MAHLRQQSKETKNKLVDLALRMEQFTAKKRKDDDFLCRGGLAEMSAGLAEGQKLKDLQEVPTPPGQLGKFLPSEKYVPLQEKARASMREQLLALVK